MKKHQLPFFRVRFIMLFACFLLMYILYPFFEEGKIDIILDIMMTILLLGGIYSVSERRRDIVIAVCLAVPALAILWSYEFIMTHSMAVLGLGFLVLFLSFTAVHILLHVIHQRTVTFNTIFGSLCVYVLLGLIWATLYSLVELYHPESFYFTDQGAIAVGMASKRLFTNFSTYFYFSFVTLTTLGFGDITPLHPLARSLAALEAIVGQVYLVVLVARLVALHILEAERSKGIKAS